MIKRVELTRFKKYKSQTFELKSNGITLLVGGNNAGKSTLIHAIAVWEFCKMILLHEKGRCIFNENEWDKGEGLGMSAEEFLPVAVPSLNHLWTNLKTQLSHEEKVKWPDKFPGYIMRIKCIWDYKEQKDRILEIGLSLINDRLFIRITNSNLHNEDHLLSTVYLPTLAGVLPKENKATVAERREFLGRGMAGSIIRNMIYDLYLEDQKIYKELTNGKKRLRGKSKEIYYERSPLQKLQNNLRNTFSSELDIKQFSEDFHTVLKIFERKMNSENGVLEVLSKSEYTPRDIITQGSGYLQWLSVFCILYSPNIDVLLLDEPDAHLHASLQSLLINKLDEAVTSGNEKQIFVSTHSVEIIKQAPLDIVFSMDMHKYLADENSRVAVLSGVGSEYFPKLDLLKRYKRLIFVESESDAKILSLLGDACGISLPKELVLWANTDSHATRRRIFENLKSIITDLKCISLRDRDMEEVKVVGKNLEYKPIQIPLNSPIRLLQWHRKNIESYLLCPRAIANASNNDINDVKTHFLQKFALGVDDNGFVEANPPDLVFLIDGKDVFANKIKGLEKTFGCNKYDVAKQMTAKDVPDDIKTFLTQVKDFFNL